MAFATSLAPWEKAAMHDVIIWILRNTSSVRSEYFFAVLCMLIMSSLSALYSRTTRSLPSAEKMPKVKSRRKGRSSAVYRRVWMGPSNMGLVMFCHTSSVSVRRWMV